MDVRAEATTDRSAVRTVHLAAFGDHGQVVANLVDDLRDAVARGEGLSLVAKERDQIVGHVMFSPSLLDAPKRLIPVQVLSPIGVVPACQKHQLPAYEPSMTGTLVYAEPFWRHDAVGLRDPNA